MRFYSDCRFNLPAKSSIPKLMYHTKCKFFLFVFYFGLPVWPMFGDADIKKRKITSQHFQLQCSIPFRSILLTCRSREDCCTVWIRSCWWENGPGKCGQAGLNYTLQGWATVSEAITVYFVLNICHIWRRKWVVVVVMGYPSGHRLCSCAGLALYFPAVFPSGN